MLHVMWMQIMQMIRSLGDPSLEYFSFSITTEVNGTSTYGSELVAAWIATELIIEVRYNLRMLGVKIDGPAWMLGDNQSVIMNTTIPSSGPKTKHNAIAYHRVMEAIAGRIIQFNHIKSEQNYADVLTKPLPGAKFHPLIKELLFRNP